MNDICIIAQGPTVKHNVKALKECWEGYPLIFSTWEDSDKSCYKEDDMVLYNPYPPYYGPGNLALQLISTWNGIRNAKELGYKRVLKWRQDFKCNNPSQLVSLFKKDKLNFYSFVNHYEGYLCDFFIEGDVDQMLELFSIQSLDYKYPEQAFTKKIKEMDFPTHYVKDGITPKNDIYWDKRNPQPNLPSYWLSENSKSTFYINPKNK